MAEQMVTVPGMMGQMSLATAQAAGFTNYTPVVPLVPVSVNLPPPAVVAAPAPPVGSAFGMGAQVGVSLAPPPMPVQTPAPEGSIAWYQQQGVPLTMENVLTQPEVAAAAVAANPALADIIPMDIGAGVVAGANIGSGQAEFDSYLAANPGKTMRDFLDEKNKELYPEEEEKKKTILGTASDAVADLNASPIAKLVGAGAGIGALAGVNPNPAVDIKNTPIGQLESSGGVFTGGLGIGLAGLFAPVVKTVEPVTPTINLPKLGAPLSLFPGIPTSIIPEVPSVANEKIVMPSVEALSNPLTMMITQTNIISQLQGKAPVITLPGTFITMPTATAKQVATAVESQNVKVADLSTKMADFEKAWAPKIDPASNQFIGTESKYAQYKSELGGINSERAALVASAVPISAAMASVLSIQNKIDSSGGVFKAIVFGGVTVGEAVKAGYDYSSVKEIQDYKDSLGIGSQGPLGGTTAEWNVAPPKESILSKISPVNIVSDIKNTIFGPSTKSTEQQIDEAALSIKAAMPNLTSNEAYVLARAQVLKSEEGLRPKTNLEQALTVGGFAGMPKFELLPGMELQRTWPTLSPVQQATGVAFTALAYTPLVVPIVTKVVGPALSKIVSGASTNSKLSKIISGEPERFLAPGGVEGEAYYQIGGDIPKDISVLGGESKVVLPKAFAGEGAQLPSYEGINIIKPGMKVMVPSAGSAEMGLVPTKFGETVPLPEKVPFSTLPTGEGYYTPDSPGIWAVGKTKFPGIEGGVGWGEYPYGWGKVSGQVSTIRPLKLETINVSAGKAEGGLGGKGFGGGGGAAPKAPEAGGFGAGGKMTATEYGTQYQKMVESWAAPKAWEMPKATMTEVRPTNLGSSAFLGNAPKLGLGISGVGPSLGLGALISSPIASLALQGVQKVGGLSGGPQVALVIPKAPMLTQVVAPTKVVPYTPIITSPGTKEVYVSKVVGAGLFESYVDGGEVPSIKALVGGVPVGSTLPIGSVGPGVISPWIVEPVSPTIPKVEPIITVPVHLPEVSPINVPAKEESPYPIVNPFINPFSNPINLPEYNPEVGPYSDTEPAPGPQPAVEPLPYPEPAPVSPFLGFATVPFVNTPVPPEGGIVPPFFPPFMGTPREGGGYAWGFPATLKGGLGRWLTKGYSVSAPHPITGKMVTTNPLKKAIKYGNVRKRSIRQPAYKVVRAY